MVKKFEVFSLEETQAIATKLATLLTPPDVITLEGNLGAGKTTFTQALAKGLGVKRIVNSPTYTIVKQYMGTYPLNHLDVYRLADSEEDLGWDELFYGDAISVIEWAHLIKDELPEERLEIRIEHSSETGRIITFNPIGTRYETICEGVFL